eukprot:7267385-Pyramimonas_sp.AAC.1
MPEVQMDSAPTTTSSSSASSTADRSRSRIIERQTAFPWPPPLTIEKPESPATPAASKFKLPESVSSTRSRTRAEIKRVEIDE